MTDSDDQQSLTGHFWHVDTPDRRVRGELTLDAGRPSLVTVGQLFVERAIAVEFHDSGAWKSIAVGGNADARVADWRERNIHGELDDGTLVSMIGAQGGMKKSTGVPDLQYRQEFRTLRHVILNEHVDNRTTYHSCRFRLTGPIWWHTDGDAASTSDGGRLAVTQERNDRWFEFAPPQPLTVKELGRQVLSPIETLASLATTHPTSTMELSVRLAPDSPWRKVYRDEESTPRRSHELLNASLLTADQYAHWIEFRRRSDSLDAAAIEDLSGVAIQTAVLALSVIAEALHRRIFEGKKRVPALSTSDLKQTRRAARSAAVDKVCQLDRSDRDPLTESDLDEFRAAMNDAFSFINEPTFRTRLADIAGAAQSAIPDIVAEFADWPAAVKDARNTLAHEGTHRDSETIDQFYDVLIALSYSLVWVLRTVLLVEAGFSVETLQESYAECSSYEHHLTNVRELLAGSEYAAAASADDENTNDDGSTPTTPTP